MSERASSPLPGPLPEPPGDAAPRSELTRALSESALPLVFALGRAAQRALSPFGFRPVQALVLGTIAVGTRSPKEIAEMFEIPPPQVSALLRDLEERGFLERRPDPEDRRRVLLEATHEGRAMVGRFARSWHDETATRTSSLSDEDLRALLRVAHRVAVDS